MSLWEIAAAPPFAYFGFGLRLLFSAQARLHSRKSRWLSRGQLIALAVVLAAGLAACSKQAAPSKEGQATSASQSPTPVEAPAPSPAPPPPLKSSGGGGKQHKKKPAPGGDGSGVAEAPAPEDSALSAAKNSFDTGTIAYHPPSQMVQGSTQRFELLISRAPDAALASKLENPKDAAVASIQTSAVMGATLDGPKEDFSIVALGGDATREQALGGPEPARWEWDVTALTPGDHDLDLTVYIKVRNPSTDSVVATNLVVRHSEIHVAVRPKTMADRISALASFTAANWDKLWTLILLPIGAWYWRRRQQQRKAVSGPPDGTQK